MRERSLKTCEQPAARIRVPSLLAPFVRVSCLLTALLIAGCTDQTAGGPQFANEPAPTRPATRVVSAGSPAPLPTLPIAATPIATPASMADLLRVRGAPSALFLEVDNAIWAIDSSGQGSRIFAPPEDAEIRAQDAAPGGDRVAILVRESTGTRQAYEVEIADRDGNVVQNLAELPLGPATPGPGNASSIDVIDWSPQGDQLLVAIGGGTTLTWPVENDGRPEVILLLEPGETIVSAAWSPTGEAIAYIATGGSDRDRALWVLDLRDGRRQQVVKSGDNRFVVEFTWLPDGTALLFTEGGDLEGAVSGIDLWSVNADGGDRQLVASAGSVAPVARITDVRPSPDGRSVAYAVLVPGNSGPRVDSVWVRDLASRVGFKIALPTVATVDEISWTDNGLAIAVTTSGGGRRGAAATALLQVSGNGDVAAIWVAPIATPVALEAGPSATPAES